MGRTLLLCRLAARDLRRHPAQAVLLLLAISAATITLTLGLVLNGVTSNPYLRTKAATAGPDVVAVFVRPSDAPSGMKELTHSPGVAGHSGPYIVAWVTLRAHGMSATAAAEGRGPAPAGVDQPQVTQGSWIRDGSLVIERSFAEALGVRVGDSVTLNSRSFHVAGIAVTAASAEFPRVCALPCEAQGPPVDDTGLVWLPQGDIGTLGSGVANETSVVNLRLKDPADAQAFVNAYPSSGPDAPVLIPWRSISTDDAALVSDEQQVLSPASWLLGLLALASVAVLAGGRMTEQTRRVGVLKAVGGTPGLIAAVLLVENLALAVVAAAIGLTAGWLTAPLLASPGAGLVGAPGAPLLTPATIALVAGAALVVTLAATLVPALRATRTSTVRALADWARSPRRKAGVNAVSARLPVPLLLGLRLLARKPRRAALIASSVGITVTGLVAVLTFHATIDKRHLGSLGPDNPVSSRVNQVMMVLTVALVALAVVNTIFTSWATTLDARRPSALARVMGATPRQVILGLSAAQLLPALPGALVGVPLGLALYAAVNQGVRQSVPPAWWLLTAVLGALVAVAGLAFLPANISARRSVADILQSETA